MRILRAQMQELKEVRMREQGQVELTSQREHQKMQQVEMDSIKISAEAEHYKLISKQRDEQVTVLQLQIETMRQENRTLDAQYQVKLKRMDEQVQHQMQQLQRESENYRTEHTRLLTDREKAHFDKERLAMESESIQQERVRLQAEIERMAKERQQLVGETERLRLQNVKLTAVSEEQTKLIDSFKADREAALNTIEQLESQLHQRRKHVQDRERQLAEAELVGSSTSTVTREQLKKLQHQFATEKSKILRQLDEERRRANEPSSDRRHRTVASLAREAIFALKNGFEAEVTAVQTWWKQQISVLNSKLEGLEVVWLWHVDIASGGVSCFCVGSLALSLHDSKLLPKFVNAMVTSACWNVTQLRCIDLVIQTLLRMYHMRFHTAATSSV
ncbi:unnamed protein product [Peronospora destructor]|uniref:Uncharacterized protein n=1 Tax=Peronospora destructor TaxID=86335 RepID=A0AAV0TMM9_9STRA|nr:unnamed protein product [Peronospora destructor]